MRKVFTCVLLLLALAGTAQAGISPASAPANNESGFSWSVIPQPTWPLLGLLGVAAAGLYYRLRSRQEGFA